MLHLGLVLLQTVQLVQGTSTSTACPQLDGTSSRSIFSILWSCATTLLICVWHAIHPRIPKPRIKQRHHAHKTVAEAFTSLLHDPNWTTVTEAFTSLFHGFKTTVTDTFTSLFHTFKTEAPTSLLYFLAPELTAYSISNQWWMAHQTTNILRPHFEKLNLEWSIKHSFFAQMGGFYYCNEDGSAEVIDSVEFLRRCEKGEIANPVFTKDEIRDKSKSDGLGKFILALQLFWFIVQVVVRHFKGLAVTLVELDTVCLSVLTLICLIFWQKKPYRAHCIHVFYAPKCLEKGLPSRADVVEFKPADVSEGHPRYWHMRADDDPLIGRLKKAEKQTKLGIICLLITWFIFGGVHLFAWKYPFLTVTEKWVWRSSSLLLAAVPLSGFSVWLSLRFNLWLLQCLISLLQRLVPLFDLSLLQGFGRLMFHVPDFSVRIMGYQVPIYVIIMWSDAIFYRIPLIAVMLASLRSLPCTSYTVISWTSFIPHL